VGSATNRQNLGLEIGVDVQSFDADTTKNDVANTFTANQIISVTDNTNAALRVTQLGTGNALVVEDSTNPDSTSFVVRSNGNVGIGEVSTDSQLQVGTAQFDPSLARTTAAIIVRSETGSTTGDGEYSGAITFGKIDSSRPFGSIAGVQIGSDIDGGGLAFFTKNGTSTNDIVSERMRIDSSGNVGIGTDSPQGDLDVRNGTNQTVIIGNIGNYAAGEYGRLMFKEASSELAYLQWNGTGNEFRLMNRIGTLTFGTSNNEKMRIDTNGNLLVGREDNPSGVYNCIYGAGNYGVTTGSGANVFINSEGLFFRSTSSARYKNSIQDTTHGLAELLTLRPVTFKTNEDGDKIYGGLIAEEVHEAGLTEFVQYNDENQPDALDYGNMVSLCIKAIQEQQTIIESQQSQIDALTAKTQEQDFTIASLISRIEALESNTTP